ncbi:hypothetical protein niasHS_008768 [Heterodera schachtii]|uniref:BTB domain-containing protein n=1 Tax=Heterodera schachtii TaxID=97005 RepID=A0ABD2JCE0_HETSC
MGIFDEFIVVYEKAFSDLKIQGSVADHCPMHGSFFKPCSACNKNRENNNVKFTDITQFAALEFCTNTCNSVFVVKDISNASMEGVPLAQIILWGWNNGAQVIKQTKMLNTGCSEQFNVDSFDSFVIRILKKRENSVKNPLPPLDSSDDEWTVQIGEKQLTVSTHWLMSVSPVIRLMLNTEMREKQQRLITLNDLGVDMEQFIDFLEAISPIALQYPILPNPENVLVLLKLADFFQVDWLKSRCETHLTNCVEIPLIDRFLLIEQFGLTNLKNYFLHLDAQNSRDFFKSNRKQLLSSVISNEFYGAFIFQLCG